MRSLPQQSSTIPLSPLNGSKLYMVPLPYLCPFFPACSFPLLFPVAARFLSPSRSRCASRTDSDSTFMRERRLYSAATETMQAASCASYLVLPRGRDMHPYHRSAEPHPSLTPSKPRPFRDTFLSRPFSPHHPPNPPPPRSSCAHPRGARPPQTTSASRTQPSACGPCDPTRPTRRPRSDRAGRGARARPGRTRTGEGCEGQSKREMSKRQ